MVTKSVSVLAFLTFVSRIFGLVRSVLFASFLGTTFVADAFTIAYKIPNLLRRFVAEGSMTAAFIPVFSNIRNQYQHDLKKESLFLSRFFSVASIVLSLLCILGIWFTPLIVSFLYSFGDQPPELAVFLTRYMFAYLGFISLAAITQGVLNSHLQFAIPASTPIALNLVIIMSMLMIPYIPDSLVLYLLPKTASLLLEETFLMVPVKAAFSFATGVLIGGVVQFLMQLPSLFKIGYRLSFSPGFKDPHIKEIGKLMIPGLYGLGIYQINALIADPFVLAYLEEGSIAALNYSNRIIEFSLGVFVISLSTVMLPSLSRYISEKNMPAYKELLVSSMNMIIFISVPATIGMIVLREPIIVLLFQSGLFLKRSVDLVSNALIFHTLGLVFVGIYRIYTPAFYALKDTRTPVIGATWSLLTNIFLCSTLPIIMGIGGIALASSIAAMINCFYLNHRLKKKLPELDIPIPWRMIKFSIFASIIMGLFLFLLKLFFSEYMNHRIFLLFFISACVFFGVILYFVLGIIFKIPESITLKNKIFASLSRFFNK